MHENKYGAIGKIIVLKDSVDFKKLKAMAGKKLGIRVKRVFQANGEEIEGMELFKIMTNYTCLLAQNSSSITNVAMVWEMKYIRYQC